jgi:hypothetical protein
MTSSCILTGAGTELSIEGLGWGLQADPPNQMVVKEIKRHGNVPESCRGRRESVSKYSQLDPSFEFPAGD